MNLLDRYLAREILLPFAAGLLFLTQLLLATQILAEAGVLFGAGVSLADVGKVIVSLLPYFMGFVMPVAFLLGVVLGVARLSGDREVVAMAAAGISPARLVRVPLLLSLVVGALGVWLAVEVEPAGMRAARGEMNEILKRNLTSEVRPGIFYDQIPGYTVYAGRVREGLWEDVLIHDRTNPEAPVLALAHRGRLEPAGQGEDMQLVLEDGEVHREEAQSDVYVTATFDRAQLMMGLGDALEDRNGVARPSRELGLGELRRQVEAARARGDLPAVWRLEGYLHRKIASALAVIAFALLGAPLGASPRAGRAFGVGATFLVMVLHYLLLRAGQVMAQNGRVPAWLGLEIPNLLLGSAGLCLLAVLAWRGTRTVR